MNVVFKKLGRCTWERQSEGATQPRQDPLLQPAVAMSRKAAVIEEFDDDTEIPLPNQPLPNMGPRGPLLEAIHSSDDDDDDDDDYLSRAGPASPSGKSKSLFRPPPSDNSRLAGKGTVTDITPYKSSVVFILSNAETH